jgi:hypothetical protein
MSPRRVPVLVALLAHPIALAGGGALAGSGALAGCGASEQDVQLNVFSTHHATPADGRFPDYGSANMPRRFEDGSWTVTLLESFVTITGVTLNGCDGTPYPIDMFRGPCPEDFRAADLETTTVGSLVAPTGSYCSIEIHYGPFEAPQEDEDLPLEPHTMPPEDSGLFGSTLYLRGGANLTETSDPVPFEFSIDDDIVVEIDLSQAQDGLPFELFVARDFPNELTISKTYDRFLLSADWSEFDPSTIEDELPDLLERETRIFGGTVIDAEWFERNEDGE